MQPKEPVGIALAWQDAASRQDIERLLSLSDPAIEIVGPRGSARGHQVLREWLERAGLSLTTLRMFVRGGTVVLSQLGAWRDVKSGDVVREQPVASLLRISGGVVAYLARYDSLEQALAEAGLEQADEVAD